MLQNIINQSALNDSLKSGTDTNTFYKNTVIQTSELKKTNIKSLFTSHELGFNTFSPNPLPAGNKDWISFTLLGCFILFIFIRQLYKFEFTGIVKSFYSKKLFYQFSRDWQSRKSQIFFPLLLIYIISISFFLYQFQCLITNNDLGRPDSFIIFKKFFLLVFLYLLIKISIIKILLSVFKIKDKNSLHLFNTLIFNACTGIILLILLIFSTFLYSKFLIILNLIILVILFIFKVYRNFLIGLSNSNFSVLYNILYLCTIEILPLLLLVKLIINYFIKI